MKHTLATLRAALASLDQDLVFPDAFGEPDSWRGSYDEVAFAPAKDQTVAQLRQYVANAYGTFSGWKGGEYTMRDDTPCNIAKRGEYGGDEDELTVERFEIMHNEACREHFGKQAAKGAGAWSSITMDEPATEIVEITVGRDTYAALQKIGGMCGVTVEAIAQTALLDALPAMVERMQQVINFNKGK